MKAYKLTFKNKWNGGEDLTYVVVSSNIARAITAAERRIKSAKGNLEFFPLNAIHTISQEVVLAK